MKIVFIQATCRSVDLCFVAIKFCIRRTCGVVAVYGRFCSETNKSIGTRHVFFRGGGGGGGGGLHRGKLVHGHRTPSPIPSRCLINIYQKTIHYFSSRELRYPENMFRGVAKYCEKHRVIGKIIYKIFYSVHTEIKAHVWAFVELCLVKKPLVSSKSFAIALLVIWHWFNVKTLTLLANPLRWIWVNMSKELISSSQLLTLCKQNRVHFSRGILYVLYDILYVISDMCKNVSMLRFYPSKNEVNCVNV